jgi:hypothetical protein
MLNIIIQANPAKQMDIQTVVAQEGERLSKNMSDEYARQLRISLVRARKVATGRTLQSVRSERVLSSPSRMMFQHRVTASRSLIFIVKGRRAGAKMPVTVIGTSATGRKIFAPVAELVHWFLQLNIPSRAWFPIMRKIAKRGIKPVDVQSLALRRSQPRFTSLLQECVNRIRQRLS